MKRSHKYAAAGLILLAMGLFCLYRPHQVITTRIGYEKATTEKEWNPVIAKKVNEKGIHFSSDNGAWTSEEYPVYMNEEKQLMLPITAVQELLRCNAHIYPGEELKIFRNDRTILADLKGNLVNIGGQEYLYTTPYEYKENGYYISAQVLADGLHYELNWNYDTGKLEMTDKTAGFPLVPIAYDGRGFGRTPGVRDQGSLGTCWAFAANSALEAALLPEEAWEFSVDHMSLNHSFGRSQEIGGEYTMSMSYLLSWKGPVLEEEDPYGDGKTDQTLLPSKHVQEIQIIPKKDFNGIKEAVYLYGGVQTSMYSALTDAKSTSEYYNPERAAYFYVGTERMNHDVLIVGWDDNYPKENFNLQPEGNGAFLCMNSWGERFGEDGYFWVSYFDSSIGIYNIVYTGIEDTDNYDKIYQSDLCGWVGQLGYKEESAYFANIYTAGQEENLEAVGFYAVGSNTEYEVYVVHNVEDETDLTFDEKVASGSLGNPGYYTIDLEESVPLAAQERYAVIVYIRTPGEQRPIAVEYDNGSNGLVIDLSDGEGYISLKGTGWQSAEEKKECNLCLKAYTTLR